MNLPFEPPFPPMEALGADRLPSGPDWQFEPKWDGFRCLVFRDGASVALQSKACKDLTRYFPELRAAVRSVRARRFVLDGEIVIPAGDGLSFDALLQRIHPAESRVRALAAATPAWYIAFDVLARGSTRSFLESPLAERRALLEEFTDRYLSDDNTLRMSPATLDRSVAMRWLRGLEGVDGVVAKRLDAPYSPGERAAMHKVKRLRTADCVVAGFRRSSSGDGVASLLLGLYGDDGLLHHVGFCSSFTAARRRELRERLEPLAGGPGFSGNAPGGPSRWSTERSTRWVPLHPKLVVEVSYDHFTGGRFRHGTRLLRWRPDKAPRQCAMDQVAREGSAGLELLDAEDEAGGG